jgi:putative oxidoreductase
MNAIVKIDIGLLILRVGFSGFLFLHGLEKLEVALNSNINYTDPIGLGPTLTLILVLFTELICTVLVAVGYRVRWSSIPPIILMLVAVFIVHKNDSIMEKELAVLYLISFIVIGILGSGKYAIKK